MARLRVQSFSISLDGYGAGPGQDLSNPLGVGGMPLHQWFFATRTFQAMHGKDGGARGARPCVSQTAQAQCLAYSNASSGNLKFGRAAMEVE